MILAPILWDLSQVLDAVEEMGVDVECCSWQRVN